MHVFYAVVMEVAMARQDPLEFVIQKFFHRASLFRPRIPGNTAKRSQRLTCRRPGKVIAGEQKLLLIKKDDVTARVSRSGNHEQIIVELKRFFATNDLLETETSSAIVCVHQSTATEFIVKQLMRGDVVFVCQEHLTDATHRPDVFEQLAREPR